MGPGDPFSNTRSSQSAPPPPPPSGVGGVSSMGMSRAASVRPVAVGAAAGGLAVAVAMVAGWASLLWVLCGAGVGATVAAAAFGVVDLRAAARALLRRP